MSKYKFAGFLCYFIVLFTSCEKPQFGLEEEISLDYRKAVLLQADQKEIQIEFRDITEDFRCMGNRTCCFTIGRATVEFLIDKEQRIFLSLGDLDWATTDKKVVSDVYKGYTFTLLKAEVEPEDQRKARKYRITLKVSK